METLSALLAICAGNSPVPGEFPAERPVTRSFDVFFHLCLNLRLNKQLRNWWFETPSRPLWRNCNGKKGHAWGIWRRTHYLVRLTNLYLTWQRRCISVSAPQISGNSFSQQLAKPVSSFLYILNFSFFVIFIFHHRNAICFLNITLISSIWLVLQLSCKQGHLSNMSDMINGFNRLTGMVSRWATTLHCNGVSHWLSPYS